MILHDPPLVQMPKPLLSGGISIGIARNSVRVGEKMIMEISLATNTLLSSSKLTNPKGSRQEAHE